MKRRILVISDFDSRIKWGCSLAFLIGANDFVTVAIRDDVSKYKEDYFLDSYEIEIYKDLEKLNSRLSYDCYDILILALGGHANAKIINYVKRKCRSKRPIIVSGFNGLIDPSDPHGLLCRYGSDLICINSEKDFKIFNETLKSLYLDSTPLVLTGIVRKYLANPIICNQKESNLILFVEQAGLPPTEKQTIYLVKKIAEFAECHTDKLFCILCRDTKHKDHLNRGKRNFDLKKFWTKVIKKAPTNMIFSDEPLEKILPNASLCISFTSTALIEALALKKKVAVIKDFGIRKDIGNHVFIGSNLFAGIDELINRKVPEVSQVWLAENCGQPNRVAELNQRLDELLSMRSERNLPYFDGFYGSYEFPYFYSKTSKYSPSFLFKFKKLSYFWRHL